MLFRVKCGEELLSASVLGVSASSLLSTPIYPLTDKHIITIPFCFYLLCASVSWLNVAPWNLKFCPSFQCFFSFFPQFKVKNSLIDGGQKEGMNWTWTDNITDASFISKTSRFREKTCPFLTKIYKRFQIIEPSFKKCHRPRVIWLSQTHKGQY